MELVKACNDECEVFQEDVIFGTVVRALYAGSLTIHFPLPLAIQTSLVGILDHAMYDSL